MGHRGRRLRGGRTGGRCHRRGASMTPTHGQSRCRSKMTSLSRLAGLALMPCLSASEARASLWHVMHEGVCERIVAVGLEVAPACTSAIVTTIHGRFESFEFVRDHDATFVFIMDDLSRSRLTDIEDRVGQIKLKKFAADGSVTAETFPATGLCRRTTIEPERSYRISCQADSQRGRFEGVFRTQARFRMVRPDDLERAWQR